MVFGNIPEGSDQTNSWISDPVDDFKFFADNFHRHPEDFAGFTDGGATRILSLFDLIELWLIEGNGFEKCPTYPSFLIGCIAIMGWVVDEPLKGWIPGFKLKDQPTFESDRYGPDSFSSPHLHPVLFEEHYESLRARKSAAQARQLHAKLDAIAEYLGIDSPQK
jgi:hypothetical protein